MTQRQLEIAVASATGESLGLVRSFGFSFAAPGPDGLEPDEPELVVDCPTCGRAVAYPGRAGDGSSALAECQNCDTYFGFAPASVYVSAGRGPATRVA